MRHVHATLAPLAALAFAAAPDSARAQTAPPPVIDACYVPASGTIYRINTTQSPAPGAPNACLSATHVRFTWNQQGPKGDKGDTGATGPAATLHYQRVPSSKTLSANSYSPYSVACPTGKQVVGGGMDLNFTGSDVLSVILHESYPINDATWRFGIANRLDQAVSVTLYAICI